MEKIIENSKNIYLAKLKEYLPNSKINDINKMEDKTTDDDMKYQELISKLFREKELIIGDQNYSLGLIEDIISLAKKNHTYRFLPKIFKDIDKKLNKNSN